ncbi:MULTISPECIES: hypothetical protein [Streptomyces]|uniref:Uncharacterized protein n=1 Tax=Streptomyces viridochromogenes TaxID=1938 RepID=A0A0L8JDR7_STRVR|nr:MULTISPECIES: hypothetical protein [Streptomyces]KOG11776.1 hypothetical protein ADK34_33235 [Streptomyces viridochromogenes]
MNHADGTAPIYAELIRERGDVPGDVRQVAEEVLRDLSRVIQLPPQGVPAPQAPVAHAGVGGQVAVAGPQGGMGQGLMGPGGMGPGGMGPGPGGMGPGGMGPGGLSPNGMGQGAAVMAHPQPGAAVMPHRPQLP